MRPGDIVVYLADRDLYGLGRHKEALPNGRILVEFTDGYHETFAQIELDTIDRAHLTSR